MSHPKSRLYRRDLLLGIVALAGCRGSSTTIVDAPRRLDLAAKNAKSQTGAELWSWFDLPQGDPRSKELSGLAWDAKEGVLWGVQDECPGIVALLPDRDLKTWSFGELIPIDIGAPLDLEGLVLLPDGFIVASEAGPRVFEVDRKGTYRREIPLSPRFKEARTNKSLESLTTSPSGRFIFTTTEVALEHDGMPATTTAGTRVRIVRVTMDGEFKKVSEHVYMTDAMPYEGGDWGVADMAAINDDTLLVLERGWTKGRGNTARIYKTSLSSNAVCMDVEQLSETSMALEKTLVCDIGKLSAENLPMPKQPQASRILDNYEGLAIGPNLPDGRKSLIVISDDNAHADQVARILVLALSAL